MSGGGGQTTTQQYPPWAVPYAGGLLSSTSQYVNQDLANGYPSGLNWQVAPFTQLQNQGFGLGSQMATDPAAIGGIDAALQNVQATQQGKYLNPATNPYLQATFNAAAQPVTQQFMDATAPGINGMFAQAGSFGGSANQEEMSDQQRNLGNTLGNLATSIYGGNYEQERQNQLAQQQGLGNILNASYAPGQELLSLGGSQQAQQQNILNANTQNTQQRLQFPFSILDQLGNALTSAVGNQGVARVDSGSKGLF